MEVVDSNVALAEKQLRAFMRRMATDKLIMVMVCLVVLGIIAAIVVAIVKAKTPPATSTLNPLNITTAAPTPTSGG